MPLEQLDALLRKGDDGWPWNIFTGWESSQTTNFHLTTGMCDDYGCKDNCRDFQSLSDLLKYLQSLEGNK